MVVVLDTSAAMACCFEDEATPGIIKFNDIMATTELRVPAIWRLEFANALRSSVMRKRITVEKRTALLKRFSKFNISTDLLGEHYAWTTTLALSDRYGLTLYDASYLALAQRESLPLATLDNDLRKAAKKAGVLIYPL